MIGLMKERPDAAESAPRADSQTFDFEVAFAAHWSHVYRVLYRLLGDPAEAEDLALETFVRLHRHNPQPGSGFNLGGWLYRVATNLGLQSLRARRRRERYELAAGREALDRAGREGPHELAEQAERRRLVRFALAHMDHRRAQLLALRYAGLAYAEIADALGLSPTSIGPLLLRAEREFERIYSELAKEDR
jgi:RNA polymerase sigma-70 factor (ECF subfamily)